MSDDQRGGFGTGLAAVDGRIGAPLATREAHSALQFLVETRMAAVMIVGAIRPSIVDCAARHDFKSESVKCGIGGEFS